MINNNVSPEEIAKFNALAKEWWDPNGPMKPLHLINPLRLAFIKEYAALQDKTILDVGCGAGLLSESLAKENAHVTAIDLSDDVLAVAREHAATASLQIQYDAIAVETLAEQKPASFDMIMCMEMLEHVPNPASIIQACHDLVKPNGLIFFSTINRTIAGYVKTILGAEYILNMLPKGTHEYAKFIRPSELSRWARTAGIETKDLRGISYKLLEQRFYLSDDISANYLYVGIRQ